MLLFSVFIVVKLEELLSLSERLQAALSSLSQEKNVLERSLREEVANTQQLTREKQGGG